MSELIIALDVKSSDEALSFAEKLRTVTPWMKVGLELFTIAGPQIVGALKDMGCKVFLDLKFYDIPNTVAGAVRSACRSGADICDIHLCGGPDMITASAEAAREVSGSAMLVLGVTVLTSSDAMQFGLSVSEEVLRLARMGKAGGLGGVVCSGLEVSAVKEACGKDFVCLCPGIRPGGAGSDDQKRVMTPGEAVRAGADFLVVGRPVMRAEDPAGAARAILNEMRT